MSAFLMNQREKVCWISSALGWPLAQARANASFNREKSLFFRSFPNNRRIAFCSSSVQSRRNFVHTGGNWSYIFEYLIALGRLASRSR